MTSPIPLLHEGDNYQIYVTVISPGTVKLNQIVCYRHNENVEGVITRFFDLDDLTKRAIIKQINRRYKGRNIVL